MGARELIAGLAGHQRVVVDTAPLIYFLADVPKRASLVERLLQLGAEGEVQLVASTITVAELLVAPLRASNDAAVRAVQELLDGPAGFELIEVDRDVATRAAQLRAELGLRLADATVAATAQVAGCSALLANDRAFERLGERLTYLHLDRFA